MSRMSRQQQKAMFSKIKYSKTWQVLYKRKKSDRFFERTREFPTKKDADRAAKSIKDVGRMIHQPAEIEVINIEREK